MIRMMVRHKVANFSAWRQGYDSFDAKRRKMGVRDDAWFRGAPDTQDVTVWHDFDTLAAAQAFVKSPELAAAMKNAGVVGEPQVWFVEREKPA